MMIYYALLLELELALRYYARVGMEQTDKETGRETDHNVVVALYGHWPDTINIDARWWSRVMGLRPSIRSILTSRMT